jgi:hypothetical protein
MIRIGFNKQEKNIIVTDYLKNNPDITKVYIIYSELFKIDYQLQIDHEYIEFVNTIEYVYFYRFLAEITDNSLIIIDECMRTSNRNVLTYNCIHHFLNQTKHKIIFEYFPIISNKKDFMILLNFQDKDRYKKKSFSWDFLAEQDIVMKYNKIIFEVISVSLTDNQIAKYKQKVQTLFDNLGDQKDPDIIPRNLQLYVGNLKKNMIDPTKTYLARNKRFNLDNVYSYQELSNQTRDLKFDYIIDFHYRQLHMNDYIKLFNVDTIRYLSTDLSIDNYYVNKIQKILLTIHKFARYYNVDRNNESEQLQLLTIKYSSNKQTTLDKYLV